MFPDILISTDQDASRLHLIPSANQRPLNYQEGLKTRPVWELSELRSENRWTNVQSITGLGQITDRLNKIKEDFNQILTEASDLAKDLDGFWTPVSSSKTSSSLLQIYFVRFHQVNPTTCCLYICTVKRSMRLAQEPQQHVNSSRNSRIPPPVKNAFQNLCL